MAYYGRYGYRTNRRSYRRGYRRYSRYGTSLRRYRSVQMNDNETKVMTFCSVRSTSLTVTASGSATTAVGPLPLLSPATTSDGSINPSSGRVFFAGMMFDRLRFRSFSVIIRPTVMPSSAGTSNYVLYASWDRYGAVSDGAVETNYSIQSDPSAKQVVWTPGGSGTPLRTWIYATNKDRYQYFPIVHNSSLVSWNVGSLDSSTSSPFNPTLLIAVFSGSTTSVTVQFTVQVRATVEFQGGYSNNTLNYTPASGASVSSAVLDSLSPGKLYELRRDQDIDSLTQRIQQFQRENPDE